MTNLPDIPKLAATSNILITKAVRPASNWYPQTLPMQLARSRHPFNTRKVPLNAASFLTWHGSWISVVKDTNVNTTYTGLLHKHQPSAEHHPCYSGLQVQGAATTPAARSVILYLGIAPVSMISSKDSPLWFRHYSRLLRHHLAIFKLYLYILWTLSV